MNSFYKEALKKKWFMEWFKAAIFTNGLVYFIGRLPIIGKSIPTGIIYSDLSLKKAISIIKICFSFLLAIFGSLLPYLLSFLISKAIGSLYSTEPPSVVGVWFVFFILIWPFFLHIFYLLDKKELQFIDNFKLDTITYLKENILLNLSLNTLLQIPGLVIFGVLSGNIFLVMLFGLSSYLGVNLLYIVINIHMTLLSHRLPKKIAAMIGVSIFSLIFGYFLLHSITIALMPNSFIYLTGFIINMLIIYTLLNKYKTFPKFTEFTYQTIKSSKRLSEQSSSSKKDENLYLKEGKGLSKKMTIEDESFDHLSGNLYLNALFFSRFKQVLRRQLYIKVGIICSIGAVLTIVSIFFPPINMFKDFEIVIYSLVPALFFILYFISVGKSLVQSMFMNCDISMLHYPFYREKKSIVSGFFYRLKRIFIYNAIVNGSMYLWLMILSLVIVGTDSFKFLGIVFFIILSLTLLFSFHELFIYYMLQPFTSNFQVVNPIYKIVTYIFYMFAYMNIYIKGAGITYAVILSLVSIIYVVIGSIVVAKYAPKTFKLKN